MVKGLGKEELCAVADGLLTDCSWPPKGGCVLGPRRYQGCGFQAFRVRMAVGASGWRTQCRLQLLRAVDGSWVKNKDVYFSLGAKDRAAADELWRHQVALLLHTFWQPLGRAQSAERGSPNHSPRCPTGAQGKGAL